MAGIQSLPVQYVALVGLCRASLRADLLCHSLGVGQGAVEQSHLRALFNINFTGVLLTTQIFARDMVGREGGNILNISSMNAYTPLTKIPAYSGAKAAVSNFTQWLAVHFAKTGIRVNAIAPGFFSTRAW